MPALAGLAPLVVALLAMVLAIAADIMLQAIGKAIGKVGIGPVTWDIGSFFVGKAEDLLNWAIHNLDSYFDDIANWFVGHILTLDQFFGAAVSAVEHLGDQIAHIVNTSVPNAIHAAEAAAGAHAQDLVNGVERDLTADVSKIEGIMSGDVKALNQTISGDVTDLTNLISKSVTQGVAKAETYTDDAITTTRNYVDKEFGDAESYAAGLVSALASKLGSQLSNLTDTVASNLTAAENYAKAQATQVYNEVEGDLSTAKATLQAGISTAESAASSAAAAAAADLTTAENFATSQVAQGVSTAEAYAGAAAGAAATGAADALEGALGGIYTDLTGKALAVNGDLSTAEGLIAGAILSSIGAVAARVSKLEECSVGVCDDSPNNFGNLLNDALGLVSIAGVGVFLAELINDPAGAEAKYSDAIGGLVSGGQSLFDSILSL
jgi:hypothetical protein